MPSEKIKGYLNSHGIRYVTISHSPAYTSQEIAASAHISGKMLAKTVAVLIDGRPAMAVMPANEKMVIEALRQAAGAGDVELVPEERLAELFPGTEPGAEPPLGGLYGAEVYVSPDLGDHEEIAFNAGNFSELIVMRYYDYERLENPNIIEFTRVYQ